MAAPKEPPKAKLVCGIMWSNDDARDSAVKKLAGKFGEIDSESETYDFSFTDYYEDEMGRGIKKKIVSFRNLISREALPSIKIFTNQVEEEASGSKKRAVNLDSGYLTEHNVVLASAKERPHKPYIGEGIFADVVLMFRSGNYEAHRYTFPDHKEQLVRDYYKKVREIYLKQRKNNA